MLLLQRLGITIQSPKLIYLQKRGMKAYIQVVGNHSAEGLPSMVLHYDSQRYIFNVRESTQRLCVQEKVKLGKANQIFLSQVNWDCVGGLTGLLLTLTDAGLKKVHLHGPKNLTHLIAATRRFAFRTSATLEVDELREDSVYRDKNLTIEPVLAFPFHQGQKRALAEEETKPEENPRWGSENSMYLRGPEADDYRKKVVNAMFSDRQSTAINEDCTPRSEHPLKQNSRQVLGQPLPLTSPEPVAISYICRGATLPGKFKKQAAVDLGIPPGPVYGKLHKGETVTLPDGRVITQDMVCEPAQPGHCFVLIDCPSLAHLDSLVLQDRFKPLHRGGHRPAHVVFHFLGPGVLESERYRHWLAMFDDSTEHVFSSVALCPQDVQFTSHALCQLKLAKLNPEIFPVPYYSNQPALTLDALTDLPPKSSVLSHLATYTLEPSRQYQPLDRPLFDHTDLQHPDIKAIETHQEYKDAVEKARAQADKVDLGPSFAGDNVEIITLGTGSSIPAKYRNVSATLIRMPDQGSVMLDAGEGTYGQMMRRFSPEELKETMENLQCVFVSHLHADHHLGVIQLIKQWTRVARRSHLTVIAPRVYRYWLDEYFQVEKIGHRAQIQFIGSEQLLGDMNEHSERLKEKTGFTSVQPVEVVHCRWAYGLSLEHSSGWKLVYSGDTRPCDNLIEKGKDATVLIHEATFDDSEQQNAIDKRHTTTGEAIEVGQKMKARYTLLNHFSQRYPKIPSLSEAQANVCFSFDLMSTKIRQIPILPKYTEAMQLVFKEGEEPEDEQVCIK